ncbi:MAG TPA: hypothetical protein VI756_15205 [Blastocatellia bacterium]
MESGFIPASAEEILMELEIKLTLPDGLAREAEASGLLTPESITSLLSEEIRRRRVEKLFDTADRLAVLDLPSLTDSDLEAEIEAVRKGRRST